MKTSLDDERCFCQALSLHDFRSGVSRYTLKLHVLAVLLICSIVEANHKISLSVEMSIKAIMILKPLIRVLGDEMHKNDVLHAVLFHM